MRHRQHGPDVVRITTAPLSREADIAHRQKRYVISMTVRTLCFLAAVTVALSDGPKWLMWVLIAASFILPYVAVVMANSSSPRIDGPDLEGPDIDRRELPHRP
ncbi:MAG: hypothetical protein JWR35_3361 [Marmoricola sp.]|jgi:hypothetical protein|nr:hypothetical protein [Marmoricola sp.]